MNVRYKGEIYEVLGMILPTPHPISPSHPSRGAGGVITKVKRTGGWASASKAWRWLPGRLGELGAQGGSIFDKVHHEMSWGIWCGFFSLSSSQRLSRDAQSSCVAAERKSSEREREGQSETQWCCSAISSWSTLLLSQSVPEAYE